MTHDKQADLCRVPGQDAGHGRADRGNLFRPGPGASAGDRVEPLQRPAAAVEPSGLMLCPHQETGGKRPRARLVPLATWIVSPVAAARPAGIPKSFEVIERRGGKLGVRIDEPIGDR